MSKKYRVHYTAGETGGNFYYRYLPFALYRVLMCLRFGFIVELSSLDK